MQKTYPNLWGAVLNEEVAAASGTVPQAPGEDVTEYMRRNVEDHLEDRRIGDEAKEAVKQLVSEEITTLVEETWEDIIRTSYHDTQSVIGSVLYNVVVQVILDLLPKEVISETLEAYLVRFFDTYAAAYRLSKKLLASSSFMALIATFVPRKTDSVIANQNTVLEKVSEKEAMAFTEEYGDTIKEAPS